MTVTARAKGADESTTASVEIVVTDGPWGAVVVLALGVFLSFLVGYLRGKREDVSLETQASAFASRVDEFLKRRADVAEKAVFAGLRRCSRQIQLTARSEGANAAEAYLRGLENGQQALADVVAAVETTRDLIDDIDARIDGLDKHLKSLSSADAAHHSELAGLKTQIPQEAETFDEEYNDLLDTDYFSTSDGITSLVQDAAKLKEETEKIQPVLRKLVRELADLAGKVGFEKMFETATGDDEEGTWGSPYVIPGAPLSVVMDPFEPRADEPVAMSLSPDPVWGVSFSWRVVRRRWLGRHPTYAIYEGVPFTYSFPRKGGYDVFATVTWFDEAGKMRVDPAKPRDVRVRPSLYARQKKKLTYIDLLLSGVSFIFALVTGMWLFYYRDGLQYFGDPEHYFQLFLWGIGVDAATKRLRDVRDKVEVLPSS